MHLYNLPINQSKIAINAVIGKFIGNEQEQIIFLYSNGDIELLELNLKYGKFNPVCIQPSFCHPYNLTKIYGNGIIEHLILTSNSGKMTIIKYDNEKKRFLKLKEEKLGKNGIRKEVPGKWLSVDNLQRGLMVSAIKSKKNIYITSMEQTEGFKINKLIEIESPSVIFGTISLDHKDNIAFVVAEKEIGENDYTIIVYEIDSLLLKEKIIYQYKLNSEHLILVKSLDYKKKSFIIATEEKIEYHIIGEEVIKTNTPKRQGQNLQAIPITSISYQAKDEELIFIQYSNGDIIRLLIFRDNDKIIDIAPQYFDTIIPAKKLLLLKDGFLLAIPERNSPFLFQFISLKSKNDALTYYTTHPLENLVLIERLNNHGLITCGIISNHLEEDIPQIYLGTSSDINKFSCLRIGIEVSELAYLEFSGQAESIWNLKIRDNYESTYVLLSISQMGTLVFKIDNSIHLINDSPFITSKNTIYATQMQNGDYLQCTDYEIIIFRENGIGNIENVYKWDSIHKITQATSNGYQIVIITQNEMLHMIYTDGNVSKRQMENLISEIECISLGPVSKSEGKRGLLAIGSNDLVLRIYSLEESTFMKRKSTQVLNGKVKSLFMGLNILHVGMESGVYAQIYHHDGNIISLFSRLIGINPVIIVENQIDPNNVLILSMRPWVTFSNNQNQRFCPLFYQEIRLGTKLFLEGFENIYAIIHEKTLKVLELEKLYNIISSWDFPTLSTPRCINPLKTSRSLVMLTSGPINYRISLSNTQDDITEEIDPFFIYRTSIENLEWKSYIVHVDPTTLKNQNCLQLKDFEAITCVPLKFNSKPENYYLAVSISKTNIWPRNYSNSKIRVFQYLDSNLNFEILHDTDLSFLVRSMISFNGFLLAGVGNKLRLYDLGKKRLLCKSESHALSDKIVEIKSYGNSRIFVGLESHSVMFFHYDFNENIFIQLSEDYQNRWIKKMAVLDMNTIACGDKFGNFFISRFNQEAFKSKVSCIQRQSSPIKNKIMVDFYIGEMITCMQLCRMIIGKEKIIVYTTLSGGIGAFIPFESRTDVNFFTELETEIRKIDSLNLSGNSHISWRSTISPIKNCVDGSICELYEYLSDSQKQEIAKNMKVSVTTVISKLRNIRLSVIF